MAKYCKAYKLRVTYLDCMECEDKQCREQTRNVNMEEHRQTKIASYAQNMESVNLQKGEKNYGKALSGTRTRADSICSIRK